MTMRPGDRRWAAFAAPGADPAALNETAGGRRARRLMASLYEPYLLGRSPGLPARKVSGACRLCGLDGELTFEHLPPSSAGNDRRAKGVSSWTMLEAGTADFPRSGWVPSQRGVGAYVTCADCNNRFGRRHVTEYATLAQVAGDLLLGAVTVTEDSPGVPGTIDMNMNGFGLGLVARQSLAMLVAVSGGAALTKIHPDVRDYLLHGGPVPTGLRLGLALALGNNIRLSPPVAASSEEGVCVFVEVAAEPFRWTLSWEDEHLVAPSGTADVTAWLALAEDVAKDASVSLPVGMIIGPSPGDTRDAASIAAQRAAWTTAA